MIEILIVVIIIFILAGILYPALAKAKHKARTTQCATAQKQIMVAIQAYINNYDDGLPLPGRGIPNELALGAPGPDLFQILASYVDNEKLFWCPGVSDDDAWLDGSLYRR